MMDNRYLLFSITLCICVFAVCEFFIYYIVVAQCSWPIISGEDNETATAKVLFLADTHLLGPRYGHWFDKLRREWQMHRAFQSALTLFQPNAVIMLGDIFDEGQWSDSEQFSVYLDRFKSLFSTPPSTELIVVPGNHDIGFHYVMTPRLISQFHDAFNLSAVQLRSIKGSHFVIVNSMAFEGDDCDFCVSAERQLWTIGKKLGCIKSGECAEGRPIVLQHFPMYRKSDGECHEPDEAPTEIKHERFKEKWDCLSKNSSEKIYNWLNPRLIFTGHTHHGCHTIHKADIHEFTLPSFSWRNKNNPSFILSVITPSNFSMQRCLMPQETTVIKIYTWTGVAFVIISLIWLTASPLYHFLVRNFRLKVRRKDS